MNLRFATFTACDARYVQHLRAAWPTWRRCRFVMEHPLVVIFDNKQLQPSDLEFIVHRDVTLAGWSYDHQRSQRENMLSGFLFVPSILPLYDWYWQTHQFDYWLKLDADALYLGDEAAGPSPWPDPAWFEGSPEYICPAWGYSKPADTVARLDAWAEAEGMPGASLNIPFDPDAETVRHKRIASWVSFWRADYTAMVANLLRGKPLPIPSQDGIHWYVAERLGLPRRRENGVKRGWTTVSGVKRIAARAAEILR